MTELQKRVLLEVEANLGTINEIAKSLLNQSTTQQVIDNVTKIKELSDNAETWVAALLDDKKIEEQVPERLAKRCLNCNKRFTAKKKHAKYCSDYCRVADNQKKSRERKNK